MNSLPYVDRPLLKRCRDEHDLSDDTRQQMLDLLTMLFLETVETPNPEPECHEPSYH